MKMKFTNFYTLFLSVFILLVVYSCQTEPLNSDENLITTNSTAKNGGGIVWDECSTTATQVDLIAGQNMVVGYVSVSVEGDNYKIAYHITNDDYCLSSTHLSVVESPSDFPNANGNAIPGQFEYSMTHDCIKDYEYTVPTSKGTYIAAHAVVNCIPTGTVEDLAAALPGTVDFCLRTGREIDGARSYFKVDIAEGVLAGTYWAWCADENKSIDASGGDHCYQGFNVYTLLDDLSGIVSQPDNIDNALWLINHSAELLDSGDYLYGHIQWALWKLLNNQECNSCNYNLKLPPGDITVKGMELYDLAMANGEGYSPVCGENTIVILDDGVHQPIIIPFPIPCGGDCEETAWGDGCDFPGKNWSTYFQYGE